MFLDWTQGVRERHSHGSIIRHFPCPSCRDPSAHLGVGLTPTGSAWAHCLRCGANGLPKGWTVRNALGRPGLAPDGLVGLPAQPEGSAVLSPPRRLADLPARSAWAARLRFMAEGTWPALPWNVIREHAHAAEEDPLSLWFPYQTLRLGEEGWFIRRFGKAEGKARNLGPHEPSIPAGVFGKPVLGFLVVEGMADALACLGNPSWTPVVLFGTGMDPEELSPLIPRKTQLFTTGIGLLLDGDQAGQECQRKLSRWLLQQGAEHQVFDCEHGKDPADMGPERVADLLRRGGRRVHSLSSIEA